MTIHATSLSAADCGHCSRPAPSRWRVTAPQVRRPTRVGRREPWGKAHLRREGDAVTACGLVAVEWHVFWDVQLSAAGVDACSECVGVLREVVGRTR
ncbi:hypothetical protein GCM10028801_16810 [Nocardioides maradonensis]